MNRRGFLRMLGQATAVGAALPVIDRLDYHCKERGVSYLAQDL